MSVLGVESLIYGAADLAAGIKFQKDWGMSVLTEDAQGAEFSLLDGTTVIVRAAGDSSLPPAVVDWAPWGHSTLREAVWGVDTQETLDQLVAGISSGREITVDENGIAHTVDDFGYPVGLAVTKRKPVEAPLPKVNAIGSFTRFDEQAPGSERQQAHPYAFSHMVYWVNDDPRKFLDFYVDKLGFRVTDQVADGSTFMQASGRTDHHNLFLQLSKDGYTGFQHVSYEFKDFDAVMMLGLHMEDEGWKTNVGPIRHNIGSSLSWYIWNPAGGVSEALTDQDQLSNKWTPRVVDTKSPDFYGHTWVARKEHQGIAPAQWVDD